MSEQFEAHLAVAEKALDQRQNAEAAIAFQAALASAGTGLECALALVGLAILSRRNEDDERALSQFDQARACLPLETVSDTRTADTFARICLHQAMMVTLPRERRYGRAVETLDEALDRFLDLATASEPLDPFAHRLRESMIDVLNLKAGYLESIPRTAEAIACREELIQRFENIRDPTVARHVARALLSRASHLRYVGRQAEEMSAYDVVIARYGDHTERPFVEVVTSALEHQLEIHEKSDDHVAALAAAEEIIRRSEGHTDWMIRQRARDAVLSKAQALIMTDRVDDGRRLCDEIVAASTDDSQSPISMAPSAFLIKGGSYSGSDLVAEIACYDAVIERYGDENEISLARYVCRAWIYKGAALRDAGRIDEAAACFGGVVDRYGDSPDPILKDMVDDARANSLLTRH